MSSRNHVSRKKQLNRIAATKYREKKRAERETASSLMKNLESQNIQLRSEVASVEAEINYLKKLINEIDARSKNIIFL